MKSLVRALGALVVISAATSGASAQTSGQGWPNRPIRMVVPYTPGGYTDMMARLVSERIAASLGQSIVIENKPGANAAIGTDTVAKAAPDGYTFGTVIAAHAVNATLKANLPYNTEKDFTYVSLMSVAPLILIATPSLPAKDMKEFIALAKAKPGGLNYGSDGNGSIHHVTMEAMNASLGISMTHIPFRGSAVSVPAMIGGQVDMVFASPPSLMGFVKSGQARLLATNSTTRSPLAPQMPTLAEKIPGFDFAFTVAVLAKTGTPSEVISKVNAEINRIVKVPDVIEQLRTAGVDPAGGTPEQLARALRAEKAQVTDAAARAQLKAE